MLRTARHIEGIGKRRRALQRIRAVLRDRFQLTAETFQFTLPKMGGNSRRTQIEKFLREAKPVLERRGQEFDMSASNATTLSGC